MKKYYIHNGVPVTKDSGDKDFQKWSKINSHLLGCECNKKEFNSAQAKVIEAAAPLPHQSNVLTYVLALMAQANQDRLGGKNVVQDLDNAIDKYLKKK